MGNGLLAIPAYNEEASLGTTLEEAFQFWPRENIIVVDDGSRDSTSQVALSKNVLTLVHPTNLGYGATLQTAAIYAHARGYEYLVFMDADGQHDPKTVQDMVQYLLASELDVVIGSRFKEGQTLGVPLARRMVMSALASMTSLVIRQRLTDTTSGFKAIRRRVLPELQKSFTVDFHSEFLIYLKMRGYKLGEYPVTMRPRVAGKSMLNLPSLLALPPRTLLGTLVGVLEALASKNQQDR